MLSFLEGIADRDRARVLGSQIFSSMDRTHEAYAMLFVFSTAGRLAALWRLRRGV